MRFLFWLLKIRPAFLGAAAKISLRRPSIVCRNSVQQLSLFSKTEGVPRQLVAVVPIESGAQPLVVSPRQARGLWQFIPETARQYGLSVNERRDERIYIEAGTRAAARYLRDLHNRFGDWPLALAAYNAGEASVEGALAKRTGSTFWQLSSAGLLPQETRNYVPAVLAAIRLLGSDQPAIAIDSESQHVHWLYASSGVVN